ncbi:MAG: anti-sigma F factor [Christensenellales bacterium]
MAYINEMSLKFNSLSENESFARLTVANFCSSKFKNIEDISDIKTAVSEAVTNSIVHGYSNKLDGIIEINCVLSDEKIVIEIVDYGVGIEDIDKATKPFFTTKPDMERSGMGFTVMEGFMDKMFVESQLNKGTKITLIKYITKEE